MAQTPKQTGGGDDFTVVSNFELGYRNREDITNLPPGVLVKGSQNVLTTTAERISARKGYTLDGGATMIIAGITSSADWDMHIGEERHVRVGFNTSGSNGKMQYRYVDTNGVVTWRDLMTNLDAETWNFDTFWDYDTEKKDFLLFVNGSSNIYEWSGGLATYASSTFGGSTGTITIAGAVSIPERNFYSAAAGSISIAGVSFNYGTASGNDFGGVTPDPTIAGLTVGDIIHQEVKVTPNSAMTDIPATFANSLIANLRNQIYIGSLTDRTVYISKLNDYTDYSFATPRAVGEGALVTLDGVPTAFIPQEDKMTVSANKDQWYETQFVLSSDLQNEAFQINRLKTTSRQGARSQAATTKLKNDIAFISFEPTLNTIGRIKNVVLTQQTENISNPIKNDFDAYDFSNCSTFYFREFLYVAVPAEGLVRIYNLINGFWEAPQILPISRFSIIDGELYGHSYQTSETYQMFTGYNDNGAPIDSRAYFSYNNYGTRTKSKGINSIYSEGYMSPKTNLTLHNIYEIDGCALSTQYDISGTSRFVCTYSDDASLGKVSLGKNPLGSSLQQTNPNGLPPKFRWIRTFPEHYFYEHQIGFTSNGIDQQWEILAFGVQLLPNTDLNNAITE